jgi:hypothetical protein
MYRTALATLLLVLATASLLHADPNPAALAPRSPPANATRLASGVAWVTLVAGHGPHPRATDWVLTYGGTSHTEREFYYSPSPRDAARFATFIAFTDMAIGEKRRYWLPDGSVEDIEIVAVVPRDRVNSHPVFPAPSDALVGTHGERYVVIEAAKPGTRTQPADRVMMRVVAIGDDDYVKLAIPEGRVTVDDITVPPVAAAVSAMGSGERRMIWTTYLGKPLWLYIEVFSVEHRSQIAPPAGFAQIPHVARAASDAHYVVLEQGTGEPPDRVDGVTLDYAMWTLSGRTIESTATNLAQAAGEFSFGSQLVDMRVGEHRRIWLQPELTTKYPEAGAGAVVDVRLVAIQRQLALLPHGLRVNTDGNGAVVLSRGATRAALRLAMRRLETMALSGDTVTFSGETDCDMPAAETHSVAELDAIIDATEALQLAAAGKNVEAIHGLVSAIAHTHAPGELQFQLAAVQVAAGQPARCSRHPRGGRRARPGDRVHAPRRGPHPGPACRRRRARAVSRPQARQSGPGEDAGHARSERAVRRGADRRGELGHRRQRDPGRDHRPRYSGDRGDHPARDVGAGVRADDAGDRGRTRGSQAPGGGRARDSRLRVRRGRDRHHR